MKPALLVLAAGMGSRYGGLKQLDQIGPNGETIIDYSVFDAIRAGFGKVVFVIRKDFEEEFKSRIGSRYAGKIAVDYAFQSIDDLPGGYKVPAGRSKPWGTGHAILAARDLIKEPFAAINGDDFYGRSSFKLLADYLSSAKDGAKADYSMCGFILRNVLSDNGSVSRGICTVDNNDNLKTVIENTKIIKSDSGTVISIREDGAEVTMSGDEVASMNMWGFTPSIFEHLEKQFINFLEKRGLEEKSEFYIPAVVDQLIRENIAEVKVMVSPDSWFGVTYREDREYVIGSILKLVQNGTYPEKLF